MPPGIAGPILDDLPHNRKCAGRKKDADFGRIAGDFAIKAAG